MITYVVIIWIPSHQLCTDDIMGCFVPPISANDGTRWDLITRFKVYPQVIIWLRIRQNRNCFTAFNKMGLHRYSKELPTRYWYKTWHVSPFMQHTNDLSLAPINYWPLRSDISWIHPLQHFLSWVNHLPWRYSLTPIELHQCSTFCKFVRHSRLWCVQEITIAVCWPEMQCVTWIVMYTWRHAFQLWTAILAVYHCRRAGIIIQVILKTQSSFVHIILSFSR